jgi:hypothetical protein
MSVPSKRVLLFNFIIAYNSCNSFSLQCYKSIESTDLTGGTLFVLKDISDLPEVLQAYLNIFSL